MLVAGQRERRRASRTRWRRESEFESRRGRVPPRLTISRRPRWLLVDDPHLFAPPLNRPWCGAQVVGPSYGLSVRELNFGVVSYSYRYAQTLEVMNTSEIPMTYVLRIPQDEAAEFTCTPATDCILPGERKQVECPEYGNRSVARFARI